MSGNAAAAAAVAAKYESEAAKQKNWDQNKSTWCQSGSFVCRLWYACTFGHLQAVLFLAILFYSQSDKWSTGRFSQILATG